LKKEDLMSYFVVKYAEMNIWRRNMKKELDKIKENLLNMNEEDMIESINNIKKMLHSISPFKDEPVDCVLWVKNELVNANDYNPNSVATPEMELLKISIENDGYTQPIVSYEEDSKIMVVDGFHRNRVGKEYPTVRDRVKGYLPITIIRDSQKDRNNLIASTIRHNRARGKHRVDAMSDIVLELKRRNWSNVKIGKQLGMDADEVLRLAQITGLAEMFKDDQFSKSWDAIHLTELDDSEEVEKIED
jgi:ParB-like chromosome segregation protein Spo0J